MTDELCNVRSEAICARLKAIEEQSKRNEFDISEIKSSNEVQNIQISNLCDKIDKLVKTVDKLIYFGLTSLIAISSFLIKEIFFIGR